MPHRALRSPRVSLIVVALTVTVALSSVGVASAAQRASSALRADVAGVAQQQPAESVRSSCFFGKTRFLLHAGLAFGAFHRYLYKPYKAGTFASGANGRTTAIVKAAIASLFVYHELKKAYDFAKCDSTLSKLVSPITALTGAVSNLTSNLKAGKFDGGSLGGVSNQQSAQRSGDAVRWSRRHDQGHRSARTRGIVDPRCKQPPPSMLGDIP